MQVIIIILGGGGGGLIALLIIALVLMVLIGSGALAGLIAALTIMLMWLAGILVGCAVIGGAAWYLTRDRRAHKRALADAERERQQIEYDQRQERKRIERQQQRAIEQATAMAPIAAVIGEAIRQGNGAASTLTADDIAAALLRQRQLEYAPTTYRAEVIGKTDEQK